MYRKLDDDHDAGDYAQNSQNQLSGSHSAALGDQNYAAHHQHNKNNSHHENQNANSNYPSINYNIHTQLNDIEMELPEEQSVEERQSNDNISKFQLRHAEHGVGFLRKLNADAYGRKSIIRTKIDQLYDTLDEKAKLQNQFKSLALYERKGDVLPIKKGEGRPIILVKWNKTQNMFELNEQAVEEFQKNKERKNSKMSFVSITGDKSTGKTFLINQLLDLGSSQEKLYSTASSENSIIMWSDPIYDKITDCEIYFLDVCFEKGVSQEIKEKLFFFQCIISNVILINMNSSNLCAKDFGCLSPLQNMQQYFEFENLEFKEDVKFLMPKIHLVMRDFAHEIKNQGYTISGQQYLESYLFDEIAFQKASDEEKKLRRRIIKYFNDRDLTTMVRPIKQGDPEADIKLKSLNGISIAEIDEIFLKEVVSLRKKVISKSQVQSIRGLRFSKQMTVQFMQSFLEDANSNEKFDIDKAVSILLENEFINVYHECVETYKKVMEQHFGDAEFMSLEQMNKSLRDAREQVYYNFFKLKAHDIEIAEQFFTKYYQLLKQFIYDMEVHFHQINNEETERIVSQMILEKVQIVQKKTMNNTFKTEDIDFIKNQFEQILNSIKIVCVGQQSNYGETYGIFVTQIQKTMMDVIVKEIAKAKQTYQQQHKDLKAQREQHQKKLDGIKNENKTQVKKIEENTKERNSQQDELAKQKKIEEQHLAQQKKLREDIENIKWLTGRYNDALKEKTC